MWRKLWRKFLQGIMDRRPTKLYCVQGRPLFYRAYLFTFLGRVWYLHHYLRSDPDDRGWHDHPMRATALILAGGYIEERVVGLGAAGLAILSRPMRPGRINKIDEHVFHRVVIPEHVIDDPWWCDSAKSWVTSWSLFISEYVPGKAWGFFSNVPRPDRKVPRLDGTATFKYEQAGLGIEDEAPWWETAPNGRAVRQQGGV